MSRMTESQLSRIDNLEIGRYGYGAVKWPGLTDVRCHDFDRDVRIERGSLTLYPDREKPELGHGLNKEAVVTLHVKPTRNDVKPKSLEQLQSRLSKLSEEFGGKFISYDMEKWIFR
ncbi:Nuclear pore complex protein Nup98-Nup96 [Cleaved into: Nuclear pore complex protein Nup98 (Nucleoporin Nup98), partial [Durusdinium trenchii]